MTEGSRVAIATRGETLPDGRVGTSWGETRGHRTHPPPVHHRKALREDAQARSSNPAAVATCIHGNIPSFYREEGACSVRDDRQPVWITWWGWYAPIGETPRCSIVGEKLHVAVLERSRSHRMQRPAIL